MSVPTSRLVQLERALVGAEKRLALLESLTPRNFSGEVSRLTSAYEKRSFGLPQFVFLSESERGPRSDAVAATLAAVQLALFDPEFRNEVVPGLLQILGARIDELLIEVQMVRACGSSRLTDLARARYPFSSDELEAARSLAGEWSDAPEEPPCEEGEILLAAGFEEKRRKMASFVEKITIVERELASLCGVGGTHLYVQRGARVSRTTVERLWVHEVQGHLLPRLAAEQEPPPFLVGAAGSGVDEEGRAVWLEEVHGLLLGRRRRDLALRFLLGLALREGGDEAVRLCLRNECERGVSPRRLARTVCRIYRGGGLAREVIYLPGYLRVKAVLEREPALDAFFQRGLVSVASLAFFEKNFPRA